MITSPILAESNPWKKNDSKNRFKLGPTLEESLKNEESSAQKDGFGFNDDRWNAIREDIEAGREPGSPPEEVIVSSQAVVAPKEAPGQLKVELPYESSLSVTGRKVISMELKNTSITAERADELGSGRDTQTFEMEQELQARIQGTVAKKTTINVNFDDTKDNVQDFSVIYKGDPDEVVQEAAFGDIVLSLPSTEFVNYNKQLFGLRANLRYKKAGLMAIGSRTKGNTETKRFTGTSKRQQIFVNDTSFIRRKYYDLTFTTSTAMRTGPLLGKTILPISDAVAEIVYIEDTTGLIPFPDAQDYTIAVPTAPTKTTTIRMRQMSRGVDYSIDRLLGIITFNRNLSEDVRVAVDYTLANGQRLSSLVAGGVAVLIKDKKPEAPGASQEIKRFYSAGARNIVRDNGLGNFVFRVLDQNRETEIGDTLIPIQRYPDSIDMDFDNGIFELDKRLPFPDVYGENITAGSALHATFSMEYQAVVRTYSFRPNIVLQSELIEVDGRKVNRDIDYFIDYDIGIVTFFNDDLIRESTVIEATYEFAPFGGQLGETLVGARGTYDILQNQKVSGVGVGKWAVGSTVLYNFAAKPTGPPDIRSSPASLLVTEGDTQVEELKFGNFPIVSNFSYETAKSAENPNLYGKALIDSMEGVKQDDGAALIHESWLIAANPQYSEVGLGTFNEISNFSGRENAASHIRWNDADVSTFDTSDDNATQTALQVSYDLNTTNSTTPEQVSLVNVLSVGGRDFSKKTTFEIEVEGAGAAGAGVDLIVEYGSFNEDADRDSILDTEDKIPFDGILNLGEDIGWEFNGPGDSLSISSSADNTFSRVGFGNARLDSEDLNNDQILSAADFPVTFTPVFSLSSSHTAVDVFGNNLQTSDLGFTGRRLFSIPLNISSLSAEEQARYTAVKQIRITIRNRNGAGTARSGTFLISRISIVGISWEPATFEPTSVGSTMTIKAVNNKDDASTYRYLIGNPAYNDLYKDATPSTDAKEQALALEYTLSPGSTGSTKNTYGVVRDFSQYKELRFFLSKLNSDGVCAPNCGEFFLQAGSETEYQQAKINVSDIPSSPNWLLVSITQADLNKDGSPETWIANTPGVTITQKGRIPNLSQISQLKSGIYNNSGGSITNQVWLNEIHVSEPNIRQGSAEKINFDANWSNWMSFGGSKREVDRLFQTPTTAINNQDRTQESGYLNLDRLRFLPITYKIDREETITPSAFQSNPNALVSFLDEGKVKRENQATTAKLILPKLPIFDFANSHNTVDNNVTQRIEVADDTRVGATYSPRSKLDLLPGDKLQFRPIPSSITLNYSRKKTEVKYPSNDELVFFGISTTPFNSTNLTQFREDREARMAFTLWNGFTFNPTYKLTEETEKRNFRDDELIASPSAGSIDDIKTPRSTAQQVSVSGSLRLLKWLEPRYSYSASGTETNGLPTLSNTTNYLTKTITRNSQGEVSGTIQAARALPKTKLLKSLNLNGSYKIENGDTYEDVPDDFEWRSKIWVSKPLDISSTTGQGRRTLLTDRKTFRLNTSWLPWSSYKLRPRFAPLSNLSITNNFLSSVENSEQTGTGKKVISKTFPDLIMTLNDSEDFFGIKKVVDESRLVIKTNTRIVETVNINLNTAHTYGTDYQFKFLRKWDISTSYNFGLSRDSNLITSQLINKTKTRGYSLQTRFPWGSWSYTPRYEKNTTDSKDSVKQTNDLVAEVFSLQIYGDVNRPFGLRFGRREIGFANRVIMNSTIKWDKKRSDINPQANYVDIYSATLTGDYTISKNFRMAIGGNFAQEKHHKDFDKLDQTVFGINSTLTIQF